MTNNYRGRQFVFGTIAIMLIFCYLLSYGQKAYAIESTVYTYTIAYDHNGYIKTQDAYMPGGTYLSEIGLSSPEDMYYTKDTLYIADSGNGRIVKYELANGRLTYYGEGILTKPTGVAVGSDGRIYIADYGAEKIIVLSPEGEVLISLARPDDIFYGASPYKPRKVGIDSYGNIFAISEGTHEGILQFNTDGSFNGFFGANKTKGLNIIELFQKIFYTEEQKSKLFFRNPPNIISIDVAHDNLVYSVTQNDASDALKKLNLAGVNIMQRSGNLWGENNYVDVAVTKQGEILAVTETGSIEEFDDTGALLMAFGGNAAASDRNGLTAVVSAIEVDEGYHIYVLDKERALIQTYYPTDYSKLIHTANLDYIEGSYQNSKAGWEKILRMNPTAYMAHNGYAKAMFQLGEYEEAALHYKLIRDRNRYSDCFWELRSSWFRTNMKSILLVVISITAVLLCLWIVRKRHDFLRPLKEKLAKLKKSHSLLRELTDDAFYMVRHPLDCFYDLKYGFRGSRMSAGILYAAAFIVYLCSNAFTSFVFGGGLSYYQNPVSISLVAILPVILFVTGSYLISSINDGEGTINNVYVAVGYSFVPYIIYTPILIVLSQALTIKEIFIYDFTNFLIAGYTLVLIFLSVKEIHCYSPGKTIGNILLTLAFMIIAILAFIILYILWKELLGFLLELFEEVKYRAFT